MCFAIRLESLKNPEERGSGSFGSSLPNSKAQSEEFEFSALAKAYYYPRAIVSEFRPFLEGPLIDVGAGIGQMTELLAQEVAPSQLQALEPDPRFAARFRLRLPHLDLKELTSQTMPANTQCKTVTSINVLEHIEDDVTELRNYHRWLSASAGFLCLLVPARPELYSAIDRDFGHFRRYTRPSLDEALRTAGFLPRHLYYFNFPGYFAWALNFKLLGNRRFHSQRVAWYDRWVFRWAHKLERSGFRPPWGQNLIAIAQPR